MKNYPPANLLLLLCAQLARNLLVIAKFLV